MEYRKLVGQRMVVGFDGTEITEELRNLIIEYKIGNIILFRHNILHKKQVKTLCEELQLLIYENTGQKAFIFIDQEGGMVTRLSEDCINMPGAMAISATNQIENAFLSGKYTAVQLKELGINFNLAPDVDVNSNYENPVIGVRSYGDDPNLVGDFGKEMTRGLQEHGIYACGKHFPGHGDTNVDSHIGLPTIHKTLEELMDCELIPFKKVIEGGITAIMTSHILFPKIEVSGVPATMSKTMITHILKEKLGFQGLVLSDCMEMKAIDKYYGTVEGVKGAIRAGVDMVFISHTSQKAKQVSNELVRMLAEKEMSLYEMQTVVDKIISYKNHQVSNQESLHIKKQVICDNKIEIKNKQVLETLLKEGMEKSYQFIRDSVTLVKGNLYEFQMGDNPLFLSPSLFRDTHVSNESEEISFSKYMYEQFSGNYFVIENDPTWIGSKKGVACLGLCSVATSVVVATYNGHIYKEQLEILNEVYKKNRNLVVFSLRNPYDLKFVPEKAIGISLYEYSKKSLNVAKEVLQKKWIPTGNLPVDLK